MSDPSGHAGSPAQFSLKVSRGSAAEFEMWRAAVAPMFDLAPPSPAEAPAFAMDTLGYFLPGMAITKSTSAASTFRRPRELIARSGVENILVQVYLEGSYELDAEGPTTTVRAGDIAVFDLRRECEIRAGAYTNLALTLGRDIVSPMIVDMEKLHGLLIREGEPRNALLRSHMQVLHREAAGFGPVEQAAVVQGTAALLAACLGPSLASREAGPSAEPATQLRLIRRAIDERLEDPRMGPASLGRQFGLSRASLYRLFEPLGGVRAYIQQRRLMRAYQLLTTVPRSREQIALVARRVGFADGTSYSRAFRGLYRMTPSDVRAAALAGFPIDREAAPGDAAPFRRLNRWLLGLDATAS